jgi:hypothetical protein
MKTPVNDKSFVLVPMEIKTKTRERVCIEPGGKLIPAFGT